MASFRTIFLSALIAATASAEILPFSRGALIIPMNSTFQSKAGQVSAYGLVYRILQANGPGHRNALAPVTVYIVNDASKLSVNRCIPTNTASFIASVSTPTDPKWNDGCDMSVQNVSEQPVVKVPYGATFPAPGATFPAGALNVFDDSGSWPRFNALSAANLTTPAFTKASYGGAPFVIDAADAQKVFDLLKTTAGGGDTGSAALPAVAFSQFSTACTAATAAALSTSVTTVSNIEYSSACHYVNIHQATVGFSAQVERRLNLPPAPFALYDPDYGNGSGNNMDSNRHGGGSNFVLEEYLKISGLWLRSTAANATNGNDSQGCALGNVSACTLNGTTAAAAGTPATSVKRGSIFDRFTTEDLNFTNGTYPNGVLNQKSAGNLVYRLFWAPHWEGNVNSRGNDNNALNYISSFIQSGGNVLGECASIVTWENGLNSVPPKRFLFTNGIDYSRLGGIYNGSNSNTGSSLSPGSNRKNCSDPGQTKPCVDFQAPGNIFSQVGDWMFNFESGYEEARRAATSSAVRPFNARMLTYRDDANLTNDFDIFNMGQQDTAKGVIVYVGGHQVSGDPLGSRIVLNSMLNLGGVPIGSERALAGPTIVYARDGGVAVDQVITPTFDSVSGYSSNPAVATFTSTTVANQKLFTWPYYPGHFRSHSMTALSTGEQSFTSGLIFDSSQLNTPTGISPSPPSRNLITWVGGYPAQVTSLDGGAAARNNVVQKGWKAETIDGTTFDRSITCPLSVSNCVDVMGFNSRVTTPTYDDREAGLHMVIGSDGLCDVQQLLNLAKSNSEANWGTTSNCAPTSIADFVAATPSSSWLLQRVRGYCFPSTDGGVPSNSDLTPSDSACADGNDNRAHLGALVHSTAAVLEPSANIIDTGGPRPTIAFVGGYDGQLHAFYVGGGANYTGPAIAQFNEDNQPLAKFKKNWSTDFAAGTLPLKGTELWSFLPASQLPWIETNSAQADSSAVVMDVFADFRGTGLREWHTILLFSLGRNSTELLALDVTNPLLPRMLWDNTGSLFKPGSTPKFSPNVLMTDLGSDGGVGHLPGVTVAPKYIMERDVSVPSQFKQRLVEYRKAYDYRDLGGTAGLSSSQIRIGLEPAYVVFGVANLAAGRQGIGVFAIEASTGQLMWQWERPYDTTAPSDNAVPVVATIITDADGAGILLVGDHEGRIWELDAATGENLNSSTSISGCSVTVPCQFPAFDTGSTALSPQPITTNIALARVPTGLPVTATLKPFEGDRVILFGTAGADWIGSPATVAGRMHVALYETARRVPITTGAGTKLDNITPWSLSAALTAGKAAGVMQEPSDFPRVFANGERVYGTITVAGSVAYFATAYDKITDVMGVGATVQGATYSMNLGTATSGSLTSSYSGTRAAYGGVAVYVNQTTGAFQGMVTSQTGSMNYTSASGVGATTATASGLNKSLRVSNNQGLAYRLMTWLKRIME